MKKETHLIEPGRAYTNCWKVIGWEAEKITNDPDKVTCPECKKKGEKIVEKIDRYDNCEMEVENGVLTVKIVVDESKVDVQPSSSGKTMVVATSGGAVKVNGTTLKLNFTLYRSP